MSDLTMGQRIAEERRKLGLSQEALGEKMGVSRQAISKWESDGAVPEVDKLIGLSKLFGVSVGWLLGVEELPEKKDNELSEEQLKVVGELVKQSQTPPRNGWRTVLAMAIAMIALLLSLIMAKQMHGTALQATVSGNQVSGLESQLQDISTRLAALESSMHSSSAPNQVLAGYDMEVLPLVVTKNRAVRAKVNFSAVPSVWNDGDTGYLCVSGGSMDAFRVKCSWDGGHLTATTILDVADGYELCFAVEHSNNRQEQQVLENEIIDDLESEFSIPMYVERGSCTFEDGTLTLTDFTAYFGNPPICETVAEFPTVLECEYRLYRWPRNSSEAELLRDDMQDSLIFHYGDKYLYQIAGRKVLFEDVNIENCKQLYLCFYVKLSNGMERTFPITYLHPDGNGGLTE